MNLRLRNWNRLREELEKVCQHQESPSGLFTKSNMKSTNSDQSITDHFRVKICNELTEEELEKVTGGKTGVTPWEGDPVAARIADAPTNLEVIKRIEVAVESGYQGAVKLAIDEAARR